jgi:hypothetical protein
MRIVKLFVAAAIPFVLLGCPDKASPDPAAATPAKDGGAAATTPAAAGSAAAPAASGGW